MIPRPAQERLLERIAAALEPGGAVVIREADASGGLGFLAVRAGNRLKALATGNWKQRFAFRERDEWLRLLTRLGLAVQSQGAGTGTPFANLLVVGRRPAHGAPLGERADVDDDVDRRPARLVLATEPEPADGL
jgi:hypothetical protein